MVFHDPTTGASNDIEKATALARAMVTHYGMTERLGAIKLGTSAGEPFMGRDYGHQRDYSEDVAAVVDEEVRALIERAHQEAWGILTQYRDALDALVVALLDRETLDKEEIAEIFAAVPKRAARPAWTGSTERIPSDRPAIDFAKPVVTVEETTPEAPANE
jgi:cell division protease FtsH